MIYFAVPWCRILSCMCLQLMVNNWSSINYFESDNGMCMLCVPCMQYPKTATGSWEMEAVSSNITPTRSKQQVASSKQ